MPDLDLIYGNPHPPMQKTLREEIEEVLVYRRDSLLRVFACNHCKADFREDELVQAEDGAMVCKCGSRTFLCPW